MHLAIVTGANRERGLGHAAVLALAEQGRRVLASGRRLAELETLYAPERARGLPIELAELDVCDDGSIEALFRRVDREFEARVDVLINNAGAIFPGGTFEVAAERLITAFDTNASGPIACASAPCRACSRPATGASSTSRPAWPGSARWMAARRPIGSARPPSTP